MKNPISSVQRFLKSEDGPTVVEYSILLGLIVVICLTSITAIGANASVIYTTISRAIGN